MAMTATRPLKLLSQTASRWTDHKSAKQGAALAYYSVLSLAPLVILVVAIAGLAFGEAAARGQIVYQIQDLVGYQGAQAVQTVLKATYKPKTGIVASALGLLTLLFGASGVFGELRDSLNTIWNAPVPAAWSILGELKSRFFSFAMVLGIGFLLLISLVVSAALSAVEKYFSTALPVPPEVLLIINDVISFIAITFLFALTYKYVPDVRLEWSDVWIGAAGTAFLFTLGKFGIGFYLGRAAVGSAYGAAASLVVVLVWVYYSAQIFLFGAEFTHVYATSHGSQQWRKEAEPVRERDRDRPQLVS